MKDATNAFSKYNLTIDVEPLVVPLFPNATKFYLNWSEDISISIDVESQYDVNTINWNNDTTIKNFNFNKTTSLLNIKLMPAKIWKPVWIQFISKDSCNRNVYSNEFWIYFNKIRPPAITNTFGPISVNRGKSKIVKIPSDLFTDSQKLKLELSTTNCIDKSSRFTKIQNFDDNENQKYIYVQSNDTFAFWLFDIYATNSYNISNQYRARLNIIQWASKDWVEWNGSYQSDWTKCVQGYEFGDSGAWLVSSTLFTLKQFTIYKILGIIVWILIILQLILCIKLKLQSLYSLFYMQTILVMMFSIEDASDEFTVFASSLLWTKFDLGFILFGNYKLLGCQQSSNKMLRLGFYWQSTFYNYMPLIIVVSILVITVIVIKKYFSDSIIIVKCKYYLTFIWNRSILSFVFVPINISPFILSNIIIDGMNLKNQFILTLISIGAWWIVLLILWFYWGRIQWDEFINKSDPSNTTCYFYLNMVRIAILSVMFIWNSGTIIYCLFSFILIAIQFCMNLTQFKDNRVLTDELLKEKLANRVVNTHMIFLMFIIWSANIYKTEFIQKIWAFMIMEFYMFMLIINLVIKLINIKKQETSKQ